MGWEGSVAARSTTPAAPRGAWPVTGLDVGVGSPAAELRPRLGDRYRDFATDRARLLPLHLVEVPEVVTPPQCGVTRMGRETMRRRHQRVAASGVRRPQSERLRRRQRWYFALMGVCLLLILLAWNLVRLWSTTAAVAMSVVAAVLPPIAVVIANWGEDR
jgi:hypothetical protein